MLSNFRVVVCLSILFTLGCSDDEPHSSNPASGGSGGGAGSAAIPAPVVNEQKTHADSYADPGFAAETITHFRTTDTLPDLDVRAITLDADAVFAGTASGLVELDASGSAFATVSLPGTGAVIDIAVLENGVAAARADAVVFVPTVGAPESWPVAGGGVTSIAVHGANVYVGTGSGLSSVDAGGATAVTAAQGFAVRDLAVLGNVAWMATSGGIRRFDLATSTALTALTAPDPLLDDDVRAIVATDGGSKVAAATATGIARVSADATSSETIAVGLDMLPTGALTALSEAGGELLIGHEIGATAFSATHTDYYQTERWVPDQRVNAVALGPDGTRWLATAKGISRIHFEDRTLGAKAETYEAMLPNLWRMDGFVADGANYADPWDHAVAPALGDFDNDGLWTHMQIGAWCFAYATTKDERFYDNARKAMDVILLQHDVPGETFAAQGKARGFITRSLVRSDEGALYAGKGSEPNWHEQEYQGKTYRWKDDTSSDEYAGHFFGTPIFYDLCAKTDSEREAISTRIHRAMSYIIDNGYLLIDLDGKKTTHGVWTDLAAAVDGIGPCLAAGTPDCGESFGGGGWLNSIEILGHLLAAWHITGDPKFYEEYERLAIEERYGEMIPVKDTTLTVTSRNVANHSDHELASVAYFTLLRYEPNSDRRAIWVQSLRDLYAYEKPERNLLEIGVMSSAMPDGFELDDAVRTFQEWPLDQREWGYDNSHRQDVELDPAKDRFQRPQFKSVLPYDEMRAFKWNGNPYSLGEGGNGRGVQGPWPYLLPYWMMRYYGSLGG